ncbi:MAG: TRAP transporter substrate-binding protein DctP [Lachnospiraceae bacterium]|nr:TRAP transporter substrate-binding protein DctP [Lachnospiraceae bacterium]
MMKKVLALVLSLIMVLSMVACGGSGDGSSAAPADGSTPAADSQADTQPAEAGKYDALDPVVMIGADACAVGAAGQLWGEAFAKYVAEITGNKLTVEYHPNSEFGGDEPIINMLQTNDIQFQVSQTAPIVAYVPEMAAFDLPMVFAAYDAATIDKAINGDNEFTQGMKAAYNDKGFVLLGFLQGATFRLTTSNKELKTIDDFKGLQIRTMNNQNHMAFWQALGAEPTPLGWADVPDALRNGLIQAQENAADTCAGAHFEEVQKYLALTNHILYCNQMAMNKEFYDSLDPAYQEAIAEAVQKATAEIAPSLTNLDLDNKKLLTDGGMEMIEYDADFYNTIINLPAVQELYTKIDADVNGLGSKLQAALQ